MGNINLLGHYPKKSFILFSEIEITEAGLFTNPTCMKLYEIKGPNKSVLNFCNLSIIAETVVRHSLSNKID